MIFWGCLVFCRENRRPKRAKFKIYLSFEDCRASVVALSLGRWWCPPVAGGAGVGLPVVFRGVFPAFWSLCCFVFGALLADMPLFGVFRGFRGFLGCLCGFVWVDVFAWFVWLLCA